MAGKKLTYYSHRNKHSGHFPPTISLTQRQYAGATKGSKASIRHKKHSVHGKYPKPGKWED